MNISEKQHSLETNYASSHVKKLRIRLGLSQEELAKRAQVSQSTISKFERGETSTMYFQEYFRLLRALEVGCKFHRMNFVPLRQTDRVA